MPSPLVYFFLGNSVLLLVHFVDLSFKLSTASLPFENTQKMLASRDHWKCAQENECVDVAAKTSCTICCLHIHLDCAPVKNNSWCSRAMIKNLFRSWFSLFVLLYSLSSNGKQIETVRKVKAK